MCHAQTYRAKTHRIFFFFFLKELIKHYDKIKITWLTRGFSVQQNENKLLEKIKIKIFQRYDEVKRTRSSIIIYRITTCLNINRATEVTRIAIKLSDDFF